MKCEQCGAQEAAALLRVSVNERTVESKYLCRDCLRQRTEARPAQESHNIMDLHAPEAIADLGCPTCGLAFSDFCRSGRLGCPQCYQVFEAYLLPLLENLHGSAFLDTDFEAESEAAPLVRMEQQLQRLQEMLNQAVREERYELAAQIRDEIEFVKSALACQ